MEERPSLTRQPTPTNEAQPLATGDWSAMKKIESYDDDDEEKFFHFQYGTNEAGREADDESSDNKALPAQGSK